MNRFAGTVLGGGLGALVGSGMGAGGMFLSQKGGDWLGGDEIEGYTGDEAAQLAVSAALGATGYGVTGALMGATVSGGPPPGVDPQAWRAARWQRDPVGVATDRARDLWSRSERAVPVDEFDLHHRRRAV